ERRARSSLTTGAAALLRGAWCGDDPGLAIALDGTFIDDDLDVVLAEQEGVIAAHDTDLAALETTAVSLEHARVELAEPTVADPALAGQELADSVDGRGHRRQLRGLCRAVVTDGEPRAEQLGLAQVATATIVADHAGGAEADRAGLHPARVATPAAAAAQLG